MKSYRANYKVWKINNNIITCNKYHIPGVIDKNKYMNINKTHGLLWNSNNSENNNTEKL